MQIADHQAIKSCPVCNQPFISNARLPFDILETPRRHSCPQDRLIDALRQRAEERGCSPHQLLTVRLAEIQCRLIRALGEVSFQQFYNPGPAGFVAMRLGEKGFDISVQVRPALLHGDIYHEALTTPGALQQRKAEILACLFEDKLRHGTALTAAQADSKLIAHLRNGPDHWDGRKKGDLSLEILGIKGVPTKALSLAERDPELVAAAFVACGPRLRELAHDTLETFGVPITTHSNI